MSPYVRLIPAVVFLFIIAWFVAFQFNPYHWCKDHPDSDKKDTFYLCQPFDFELEKGTWLERSPDHKFAGEDERGNNIFRGLRQNKQKKYNCEDTNVLLTEDGYNYCIGKGNK